MPNTLYTYYKVELQNSPLEWDETICETIDEVRDLLNFLDIYLDDDTRELKVIITGVGMTKDAFYQYQLEKDF